MDINIEKLEKIKDFLQDIEINFTDSSLIKNNHGYFSVKNEQYRCKMPEQQEYKKALLLKKQKAFELMELSKTQKIYKRQDIKKLLKETENIDLDELETQKELLKNELQSIYLDLAIRHSEDKELIETDKSKIQEIKTKFINICVTISEYYLPSVETQLEDCYLEFFTYQCTEKLIDSENFIWERVWKSLEDFQKCQNQILINEAVKCMANILMDN